MGNGDWPPEEASKFRHGILCLKFQSNSPEVMSSRLPPGDSLSMRVVFGASRWWCVNIEFISIFYLQNENLYNISYLNIDENTNVISNWKSLFCDLIYIDRIRIFTSFTMEDELVLYLDLLIDDIILHGIYLLFSTKEKRSLRMFLTKWRNAIPTQIKESSFDMQK